MARGRQKTQAGDDETRRTILRTAQQLFMDLGYRAVSTRHIADACGLTQPALYHHFSDKQALYVEVIKEDLAQTRVALERIARRNESVQERLRQVARYLLNKSEHDLDMMLHDIRQELSAETRAIVSELFQSAMIAPISSIFEDGLQQGLLRSPAHTGLDAIQSTYLFMSMLSRFFAHKGNSEGASSLRSKYPNDQERAQVLVHILFHGLGAYDEQLSHDMRILSSYEDV